jgi:A/G-specific adenine glycosylase
LTEAVRRLLAWFETSERDVPGRDESDPYRVWVAEIMAQQTRIEVMRPYYETFVNRFPDVRELANAPLDDVLKVWEGLGYYRRARDLHRAAREVVVRYGGHLPADPSALRSLPGTGPYTAGAICSIAFGLPEPAVDGNARRLLSRLFDMERPTATVLHRRARELITAAGGDARSVNQALMDLGASVCLPRAPRCTDCPVSPYCLAFSRDIVELRPPRSRRAPLPHYDIGAAVVWRSGRVLVARRPEDGLLGGLWEFPGGKVEEGETPAEAARREVREEVGLDISICAPAARVDCAYSHFRITLHAFHARYVAGEVRPDGNASPRWVETDELTAFAFPAANHGLARGLVDGSIQPPTGCR